jgi:hypothetical protein
MPMLALQPGQTLTGGTLYFGARGVQLSRDNTLSDITIRTSEVERAILNDTGVPHDRASSIVNRQCDMQRACTR